MDYDIVLIDIDTTKAFKNFNMISAEKNYFVTAFDNYSLKRGLEIIKNIGEKIRMIKILFSAEMSKEDNDYLNFLSFYYPVEWIKGEIYFPYDQANNVAIIENQRSAMIRFKNLTPEYKYGLEFIIEQIMYDLKAGDIKRILKNV